MPVVFRQHAFFAGKIRNTVSVDGQRQAELSYDAGSVVPDPDRPGRYRATLFECGEWSQTVRVHVKPGQLITVATTWVTDDSHPEYTVAGDPPSSWPHNPTTVVDWPSEPCLKMYLALDGGRTLVPFAHGDSYRPPEGSTTLNLVLKYGPDDMRAAGSSAGPEAGRVRRSAPEFVVDDIASSCSGAASLAVEADSMTTSSSGDETAAPRQPGIRGAAQRAKPSPRSTEAQRDSYRPAKTLPLPAVARRSPRHQASLEPIAAPDTPLSGNTFAAPRERKPTPFSPSAPRSSALIQDEVWAAAVPSAELSSAAMAVNPGAVAQASIGALKMRFAIGGGAGDLIYEAPVINANAYRPGALRLVGSGAPADLVRRDDQGALRQIVASSGAIDIVTLSASAFAIRYYDFSQIEPDAEGFTVIDPNPRHAWTVENPDSSASHRVRFTGNIDGQTQVHLAAWYAASQDDEGRMVISYFNDRVIEERTYFFDTTPTPHRGERITRRRGFDGPVESDVYEIYAEFYNWGVAGEVFEALVYRMEGVETNDPRVTEWTYADDGFLRGRFVTSVIHPDGYWERYIYASDGELRETFSPWRDSPSHPSLVNGSYTNCRRRLVTYAPGANPATQEWQIVEEYAPNLSNLAAPILIGATQTLKTFNLPGGRYQEETWTLLDGYEYAESVRVFERKNGPVLFDGRANGSSSRFTREWGYWVPAEGDFSYTGSSADIVAQRIVRHEGSWSQPFGIANETLVTVRVEDIDGRPFVEEVYVSNGSVHLPGSRSDWLSRHTYTYNANGNPTVVRRDGSVVRESVYDDEGRIVDGTDEAGLREESIYDELGRLHQRIQHFAGAFPSQTTTYTYDAGGNVLTETVTAGSGESNVERTVVSSYDTAGRLLSQQTAEGLTHLHAERFLFNGSGHVLRRETTETRPDRSVVITEYHQDRRLFRQYGDVPPQYVGYAHATSTGGPGTLSAVWGYPVSATFSDPSGTQLRLTRWTNWAGSTVRDIRPGFTGQGSYVDDYYFDTNKGGQLGLSYHAINTGNGYAIVGQAPRVFEYDQLGRLTREGLDYNFNFTLDSNGQDPVTITTQRYERSGSPQQWHRITQQKQLQVFDSSAETLRSETREQLSGLSAGTLAWIETVTDGRGSTTTVTLVRASATRTTTVRDHAAASTTAPQVRVEIAGRLLSAQSPAGPAPTTYTYHPFGEIDTVIDPLVGTTAYSYSSAGQLTTVTDALARTTSFTYLPDGVPGAGKIDTSTDSSAAVTHHLYDQRSRLWRQWGSNVYPQEFGYDGNDRLVSLRTFRSVDASAAGGVDWSSTSWPTDAPPGDLTEWLYHFSGLLERKRYADNTAIIYDYDNIGRVRTKTNARGQVATYSYDSARSGLVAGITYSSGSNTPNVSLLYDRTLSPRQVIDGSGMRTLTYSAGGAPGIEAYEAGPLAGWSTMRTYTAGGLPDELQVPGVYGVKWRYDDFVRAEGITGLSGTMTDVAVTYGYHPGADWLSETEWSHAGSTRLRTSRRYDEVGRLTDVTNRDGDGDILRRFQYTQFDGMDRRTRVELEDGGRWDYGYNSRGELENAERRDAAATVLPGHDFRFAYDTIGNRLTSAEQGHESAYLPNALNQYSQRSVPSVIPVFGTAAEDAYVTADFLPTVRSGEWFYGELPTNNATAPVWKEFEVVAVRNDAGPNGEDAVASVSRSAFVAKATEVFTYDADGNLTSDGRWTYTWDAENRLLSCETTSTAAAAGTPRQRLEFGYDSGSRRTIKRVLNWNNDTSAWNTTTELRFLYDGWNLVAEFEAITGTPTLLRSHLWGNDLSGTPQGAGGVGGLLATSTPDGVYLPWYDGNGNVVGYSDATSGEIAAEFSYGPNGKKLAATGSLGGGLCFGFSSKYEDDGIANLYYGFRYYNPSTGRWLSRDPIEENGGLNLYGMVDNDPLGNYDLLGLAPKCTGRTRGNPAGHCEQRTKISRPGYTPTANGCGAAGGRQFPSTFTVFIPNNPRLYARNRGGGGRSVSYDISAACNAHDICYGTCGESRADCDNRFKADILSICATLTAAAARNDCQQKAAIYYNAVYLFGRGPYESGQDDACEWTECCYTGRGGCGKGR